MAHALKPPAVLLRLVLAAPVADAGNVVHVSSALVGQPPVGLATPQARYQASISRELYHKFGHGGHGRNIYCAGPAVVRFDILPSGRVARVRLVRQSLPGLDARLVANISNLIFPRPQQPTTVVYTYKVWPLARPFIAQRSNCR